ncbi:DNA topoisomerase IB [Salinibacterium sp. ZJ77]|uniref:DNA topoisomerase IB n=1 Tax=Salinibacterium sp. ZJ77 TaxID=2708337 RepID=UPI0014228992|nr:DNA topoisomerase IB [Salinibacterium sp. ZJ77]
MRLRRTRWNDPGIRRMRSGKGFRYVDADGATVAAPELRGRIERLAIPPAWTEVWICAFPNGHIQATGVDAAGRRQYLYHPTWREKRDREKFDRALALAESLPAARRGVTIDLRREGLPRERVLAGGFRMLDTGRLRVGSERYAREHGSVGLSTLLGAHASVRERELVQLAFPGKSGQEWESEVRDPDLAALISVLKRRGPRARLLAWTDERGPHPVSAEDINADIRDRTGGDFTAKDFRTLHGTASAAVALARTGVKTSVSAQDRAIAAAVRTTAEMLGNTPAVARASYIDPRILDLYRDGVTIDPARTASVESELRALLYD